MKMKKELKVFAAAAVLSAAAAMTAYAGWGQDGNGYWYQYGDGTYASSGVVGIEGKEYLFNEAGYMVTGWQQSGSDWYYFDEATGAKAMGWAEVGGNTYYFDSTKGGAMQKGWILLNNSWYYLDEATGARAAGWLQQGGNWYYMEPDNGGVMHTGWLELNGEKYFFEAGVMKIGDFENGGFMYCTYMSGDRIGALKRNTEDVNPVKGDRIRYDEEGKANLWDEDKGQWYPFTKENANTGFTAGYDEQKLEELQYSFYGEYRKSITKSDNPQNKARESVWESKVRRRLQGMISEAEIQDYISKVKKTAGSKKKFVPDGYVDEDELWRREITF